MRPMPAATRKLWLEREMARVREESESETESEGGGVDVGVGNCGVPGCEEGGCILGVDLWGVVGGREEGVGEGEEVVLLSGVVIQRELTGLRMKAGVL